MKFTDSHHQTVVLEFKNHHDEQNGEHVLALPIYNQNLVLTRHKDRGIEFPGGKREINESSKEAVQRELYEETGSTIDTFYYIAQYEVQGQSHCFKKDVYVVFVDQIEDKTYYHETYGPILTKSLDTIQDDEKSYLLNDPAILACVERMKELGFYQS
ncbi:RNA deprotection pyrophosphohydrolase [Staphylococcus coagulans]|uniref:RNA deprotection pyrophosphohydrolase n=1 Tax=Staphylococcus coagulans TaxID=74706 RepID=UPI0030EC264A